jgi:catalase
VKTTNAGRRPKIGKQTEVHAPQCPVHTYNRDGTTRFDDNGGSGRNYEPNSFGCPVEEHRFVERRYWTSGEVGRYDHREANNDYTQAGDLFRLLKKEEKQRLIENIVNHMRGVPERIQRLQIGHFIKADSAYGRGVAEGPGLKIEETELLGAK